MFRIGLMGCGAVATYGHLPTIQATAGLELVALFDPSVERLQAAQAKFAVPHACSDMEDFFGVGLDAVAITSPAPYHLQNVAAAARHGVHVLCEKPLALTEAEIEEMCALADRAGILLAAGFDYRFSPVAQTIHRLLREGTIGELRSLRLIYIWNLHGKYATGPTGERILQERRVGRMLEGGPMVDCGVHQIDLARWWTGSDPYRWSVAGAWVDEFAAPDHMYLHLDHPGGIHTMVEISYSYGHTATEPINLFTYDLIGTEGILHYDRNAQRFELRTGAGTTAFPFAGEKNFAGMYDAFVTALETGTLGDLPSGHDGLQATHLARAATEELMRVRSAECGVRS
jgi:predicted dehydrogenase